MYILDRIEFILTESFTALVRNKWMSVSAVITAMLTLYLVGGWGASYYYLSKYSENLPSKFEMRVFLQDRLDKENIQEIIAKIDSLQGISNVELLDRDAVWKNQKKVMPEITDDVENPLPETLSVVLADLSTSKGVVEAIQNISGVEENGVSSFQDEQEFIASTMSAVNKLGITVVGLMFCCSGLLIYNTIRMTILSRTKELRIMHLVGASRRTIVLPLLVEGLLEGMLGGIIASLLLFFSYYSTSEFFSVLFNSWILTRGDMWGIGIILTMLGGFFGFVCSLIAIAESKKQLAINGRM